MAPGVIAEKTLPTTDPSQLLASLFGSGTKIDNTSTTTQNADVSGLQNVLANLSKSMSPELYQQLITSIFQTAAEQVPQLSQALAGSIGTRTSGNSPLALALNEQNNKAAAAAASTIMQHNLQTQQAAGNIAANLAQATSSKTVSNTGTEKTPAVNPLVSTALGFALNKADKAGLFGSSSPQAGVAPVNYVPTQADYSQGGPSSGIFGQSSTTEFLPQNVASNSELLSAAGFDTASAGDAFTQFGSSFLPDFTSELVNASDIVDPAAAWFADGGTVRNRNMMGALPVKKGMLALDGTESATGVPASSTSINTQTLATLLENATSATAMRRGANDTATSSGVDQAPENITPGTPEQNNEAMNSFAVGLLGILAPALAPALTAGKMSGALPNTLSPTKQLVTLVSQALSGTPTTVTGNQQAIADINQSSDPIGSLAATQLGLKGDTGSGKGLDQTSLEAAANAVSAVTGTDGISAMIGLTDGFSATSPTSSSADASAPGVAAYADGGTVKGKGTETSDDIEAEEDETGKPLKLSTDEFVIPGDTVRAVGLRFFENLIDQFHTPVNRK